MALTRMMAETMRVEHSQTYECRGFATRNRTNLIPSIFLEGVHKSFESRREESPCPDNVLRKEENVQIWLIHTLRKLKIRQTGQQQEAIFQCPPPLHSLAAMSFSALLPYLSMAVRGKRPGLWGNPYGPRG